MSVISDTFLAFEDDSPAIAVEYDYAKDIDQRNGWYEDDDFYDFRRNEVINLATIGINSLFEYCIPIRPFNTSTLQDAIRRFLAIVHVIKPELMVDEYGNILSYEKLGKLPQVDCTRCTLSNLGKKFTKRYHFHSRIQKRESACETYSKAATAAWKDPNRKPRKRKARS